MKRSRSPSALLAWARRWTELLARESRNLFAVLLTFGVLAVCLAFALTLGVRLGLALARWILL